MNAGGAALIRGNFAGRTAVRQKRRALCVSHVGVAWGLFSLAFPNASYWGGERAVRIGQDTLCLSMAQNNGLCAGKCRYGALFKS